MRYAALVVQQAERIDALVIPSGRRLLSLALGEVFSMAYALTVEGADAKAKQKFDEWLHERKNWRADERIPERLRKLRPPPGWTPYADPMADTFQVG